MDTPVDQVKLTDLPANYGPLAFLFPTGERPTCGNDHEAVTRDAADKLSTCFNKLVRRADIGRETAQRFILQMLVALFAEDIGLLEKYLVTQLLEDCRAPKDSFDLIGAALAAAVLDAYGFSAKTDLLAQLLEKNLEVARRIETGETVTAPGVPPTYSEPNKLITDDCIRP